MVLVYNKALVARSSQDIVFFKFVFDDQEQKKKWKQYFCLHHRGFLSFNKGNIRIQITTDDRIYFYLMDKETLEPKLENVMFNYLACTQMLFGKKVKYSVTFSAGQRAFDIHRRKATHNFKVPVSS